MGVTKLFHHFRSRFRFDKSGFAIGLHDGIGRPDNFIIEDNGTLKICSAFRGNHD